MSKEEARGEAEGRHRRPRLRSGGFGSQLQHGSPEIWSSPPRRLMYVAFDSPWMKSRNDAGSPV